ncbi:MULTISPECIES: efflux RND transporter periplasmic adaptor subunit [unclassified Anaeromyxobacter]|uniref:efflux RND transporter periplasmic adaptor subunit n=1 Tax=unclassified Anaeromyxobacter TaxID=2620896 RepID=UPI001F56A7BC|nr:MULTISPECIES: efflux RND transporter periplasmic adaptor subunit [unclassified Anaeromyxobacter]
MTRTLPRLAVLAALTLACGRGGGAALPAAAPTDAHPDAIGVRTVKPHAGSAQVTRATGELRARHEAVLSAETSGRIQRFLVDVGSRVKKGDVLAELDASTARIQVQQAEAARAAAAAAHKGAESDLRRARELARGDAASPAAVERAETVELQTAAALQQASAAVAAAQDQLSKHVLRAPFDGVVTARTKSAGEFVAMVPPTPVLAMVDLGSLEVRAGVPEAVADLLAPGAELAATVSPSGKPFKARIRSVGAVVEAGTRTVDVRADPIGGPLKELRAGAIVEIALGGSAAAEGLFLPAGAVAEEAGAQFVWTVEADKLKRQPVKVEKLGPGTVRVLSGVGPDALVVAESGAALKDGASVRVLQ